MATSGTAMKMRSLAASYAQALEAAERALVASGPADELERVRLERMLLSVSDGIAQKRLFRTALVGDTAKGGRDEVPKEGALLVGFRAGEGGFNGAKNIKSIQPVFRTASGDENGKVYGDGPRDSVLVAKPGYAVGAVLLKPGTRLMGIQVTFMRVKSTGLGLDPRDSYKSDYVGGTDGGKPQEINSGGKLVIGSSICSGADADALGLIWLQ